MARGEIDVSDAFWTWVFFGGLLVNVTTCILFLVLITLDLPWLAMSVGYGLSVPYNLVALVGVWRSATRYKGPDHHTSLARGVSAILLAGLSST